MPEDYVHLFAVQIRKLAAQYQTGCDLREVKAEVDRLIQAMKDIIGPDKGYQITKWSQLLEELGRYNNSTADPRWEKIISYATFRIKSRKKTAISYAKSAGVRLP